MDKNEFKIFLNDTILNEELVEGKSQEELDDEYESQFQRFDKDGNGSITKDEMQDFILKIFAMQCDHVSFKKLEEHL